MASAALLLTRNYASQFPVWRIALLMAAAFAFVAFFGVAIAAPSIRLDTHTRWITDLLVAVVCAEFILLTASAALIKHQTFGLTTAITRVLESRPLAFLGRISYSLYLTHLVVWSIIGITLGLAPIERVVTLTIDPMPIRILVLIPMQVITAYGFYLLFERPFLRRRH